MNRKKLATLLVLTTLILGMIPIVAVSAADITITAPSHGARYQYGDTVKVKGTGITAGGTVKLYWDYVTADGLKNSTTAKPDGSFEVWVDVPSVPGGDHYLWVKDVETGLTASVMVIVDPKLKITPKNVLPGESVTVEGYGFPDEADVDIFYKDPEYV